MTDAQRLATQLDEWARGTTADELVLAAAELRRLEAECGRLADCLKKANDQAENFERLWYFRGDVMERQEAKIDALEAECEALRKYKAAAMLMVEDADRYRRLRDGQNWPAVFANAENPEPLRGAELDAAMGSKEKA